MATLRSAISAIILMVTGACGGSTSTITEVTAPTQVRCATTLSAPPTLPHLSNQATITVQTTRECTWTASTDVNWVVLQPVSGQGQATIAAQVTANPDVRERAANVAVNDQQILLRQQPAPCAFTLSRTSARIGASGGRIVVQVRTAPACVWVTRSTEAWVVIVSGDRTGSGIAELSILRNTGSTRTAEVIIAGLRFIVTQTGATR
jgi:hypothetical protein